MLMPEVKAVLPFMPCMDSLVSPMPISLICGDVPRVELRWYTHAFKGIARLTMLTCMVCLRILALGV
eukprot:1157362-Pelagomonas_calceolata.AAC.5